MEFSVNTKALAGLGDMLDRRAHDLTRTAGYVDAQSYLQWGPGLLNVLTGAHDRIVREVDGFLRRAGNSHLHQYSVAVNGAIQEYRGSDQAADARLDATLPGGVDSLPPTWAKPADQSLGPEIFADPAPLVLKIPPDFRAEHPFEPSWTDVFGPSSIDRDVLWAISKVGVRLGVLDEPIDAFEAFTLPLCGDWAGLERFSFALRQAAHAVSHVSERVHEGTAAQDLVWTGHAADSCAAVLGRFAFDLQDARTALEDIATEYHEVAEAARKKGEALGHLVAVVADIVGSFGGAMIVEGPEFLAAIRNLDDLIELICHGIETLVATLEGKSAALELKADLLSLMLTGSMDASLSDAMPVLPTPPHGR